MRPGAGMRGIPGIVSLAVSIAILTSVALGRAEQGPTALAGTVLDSSGDRVVGAKLTLVNSITGISRTAVSGKSGEYLLPDLPVGAYKLKVSYPGFTEYSRDVKLDSTLSRTLDVTLELATRKESVTVTAPPAGPYGPLAATQREVNSNDKARSLNAASLLKNLPGVSLRDSGELASIPLLHGMGDDRVKVVVDGMTASASCPNHMNPPLSHFDPSHVAKAEVMAGITPVSMGGDSIGGTISSDSPPPVFAAPGERMHTEGEISTFFRNNGQGYGASLSDSISNQNFSFGYQGSWTNNDNYADGSGHVVTSTYAQNTNHTVTLATQRGGNLFVLQAGLQNTPYQGFPNQQMDMTGNRSEFINLRYGRDLGSSVLDARLFWRNDRHEMNVGKDKSTFPMPMWMPMDTHGTDLGYSVKVGIPLSERHTVQVGSEFQRFVLDDAWPAVPGKVPMMGPDTFVSINDGRRSRLAWFAEIASRWNAKWTTLLGIRNDTVWTNTGSVSGYSPTYATDANNFNASRRARTDIDIDITALARYEPNPRITFEMGYARKTRAPSLYERYAWSTNWMASEMINWFGDGNSYVGDLDLRPEIAHTLSGTASWHDRARKKWELKATPYLTHIRDYIDVNELATRSRGLSTFSQLRFANHSARIFGVDLGAEMAIWHSARYGQGGITAGAGWLHGRRLDTGTGLYQMMPLNVRFGLNEKLKGWTAGADVQLVNRKHDVDPLRYEQRTPGYALLDFNTGYQWRRLRIDAGGNNLLNRLYDLPLGGVNVDDFLASGRTSQIRPLTGPGRSVYVGLSVSL